MTIVNKTSKKKCFGNLFSRVMRYDGMIVFIYIHNGVNPPSCIYMSVIFESSPALLVNGDTVS